MGLLNKPMWKNESRIEIINFGSVLGIKIFGNVGSRFFQFDFDSIRSDFGIFGIFFYHIKYFGCRLSN